MLFVLFEVIFMLLLWYFVGVWSKTGIRHYRWILMFVIQLFMMFLSVPLNHRHVETTVHVDYCRWTGVMYRYGEYYICRQ